MIKLIPREQLLNLSLTYQLSDHLIDIFAGECVYCHLPRQQLGGLCTNAPINCVDVVAEVSGTFDETAQIELEGFKFGPLRLCNISGDINTFVTVIRTSDIMRSLSFKET